MTTSRTIKVLLSAAVGLVMLTAIEGASAKVVKWQLENVNFDDGDPVTGFFLFDADATQDKRVVGVDILLTPFAPLPAYRLNSLEPGDTWLPETDIDCGNPGAGGCILLFSKILYDIDPIGRTAIELNLWPETALSDGGGKTALSGFEKDTYLFGGGSRTIVSGQLVAVPESSKMLLILFGLASLTVLRLARIPARRSQC